jgi:hypothetical protein
MRTDLPARKSAWQHALQTQDGHRHPDHLLDRPQNRYSDRRRDRHREQPPHHWEAYRNVSPAPLTGGIDQSIGYVYSRVQRFNLFEKMKSPGPDMDAKLNFKDAFVKYFFHFLVPFRARLGSTFNTITVQYSSNKIFCKIQYNMRREN